MFLNLENKYLHIKVIGSSINLTHGDAIISIEGNSNHELVFPFKLDQIQKLDINLNIITKDPTELTNSIDKMIPLFKAFKKVEVVNFIIDKNYNYSILQNTDLIINQLQYQPIKSFSLSNNLDMIQNIYFFSKYLALNSHLQLEDIRLDIKIIQNGNYKNQLFQNTIKNLCIFIQNNQNRLQHLKLKLNQTSFEDIFELDYELFQVILKCHLLSSLSLNSNIWPNSYLSIPPEIQNQSLHYLQNLKEINLEFQYFQASRLDISKQIYFMCYKNILSLTLVNAIEKTSDLDLENINPEIRMFNFCIASITHKFNGQDLSMLGQLQNLKNLIKIRVNISYSSREYKSINCMLKAQQIILSIPKLIHFEIKIQGHLDSQNFIRFFEILRQKEYLIRLKQMNTSPGLNKLMLERKKIIRLIQNFYQNEYKIKLISNFRKDIIIDITNLLMNIDQQL